jgi:hypothetical protein
VTSFGSSSAWQLSFLLWQLWLLLVFFHLATIDATLATVASFGSTSAWQLSSLLWRLWLLLVFLSPGDYRRYFGDCGFFWFYFRLATVVSALATVASFGFSFAWRLSPLLWRLWLLLVLLPPGNCRLYFGDVASLWSFIVQAISSRILHD